MPETAAAIGTYFTAAEGTAATATAATAAGTAGTAAAGTAAAGTAAAASAAAAETGALGYGLGLGASAGTLGSGYVLPASVAGAASAGAGAAAGAAGGSGSGPGGIGSTLLKTGTNAAVSAGVNAALAPKKPELPAVQAMPDPVAQEEARKRSIIEQTSRRGRSSTILTDAGSGSLGG